MAANPALAVVQIAGAALCLFAFWGMLAPKQLLRFVRRTMAASWGIYFAVAVRLALGIALIVGAPESRYPIPFAVIGWIAIVAAMSAILIGRARLERFVEWWIRRFTPFIVRLWLLIALAFAAFLIYGAS